ncbi:MAG: YncE family protein [Terriglobia bacterium]
MRLFRILCVIALMSVSISAVAQHIPRNEEFQPLFLDRIVPLAGAAGRFDHMSLDPKTGRVFVADFGNDTVDVIDVRRATLIHTIHGGLNEPQGVAYIPESNRIVVSNSGDGSCKIFDGATYSLIGTVKFPADADQLRYDPSTHLVYVGYGEGAIGAFDARTNQRVGSDFELGVHPESFQLEQSGPRIFVNLASISQIAVINRKTHAITRWKLTNAGTNFPMALDEADHRLFVAARKPARLLVLDMDTGRLVASLPGAADSDDMWYDATRKRIYVPSGEGFIFAYQQIDPNRYERIAKILTAIGARTSTYYGLIAKHNSLYLAVPGRANRSAELWFYETRE